MNLAPNVQVLHLSVDESQCESYFRVLVYKRCFKYLTIDAGVFDPDDMWFAPKLLSILPTPPEGDWNLGHIAKQQGSDKPYFDWTTQKEFSSIKNLWHPRRVDYLSLKFCQQFIAKFARFPFEISWCNVETEVYALIEGHNMGPAFLGHITEGDRVIGFLLEKVEGRHANAQDLKACRQAVQKLHDIGIIHGDMNRHNFLVSVVGVVVVDFENAHKTDDEEEMKQEVMDVEQQLKDTARRGWRSDYDATDGTVVQA